MSDARDVLKYVLKYTPYALIEIVVIVVGAYAHDATECR